MRLYWFLSNIQALTLTPYFWLAKFDLIIHHKLTVIFEVSPYFEQFVENSCSYEGSCMFILILRLYWYLWNILALTVTPYFWLTKFAWIKNHKLTKNFKVSPHLWTICWNLNNKNLGDLPSCHPQYLKSEIVWTCGINDERLNGNPFLISFPRLLKRCYTIYFKIALQIQKGCF